MSAVIDDSVFEDNGAPVYLPGGVLATGGVDGWTGPPDAVEPSGEGLLLRGNRFGGLESDAIVLDAGGACLATSPSGQANAFEGLEGEPLYWQDCEEAAEEPAILDGSGVSADCRPSARPIGPFLQFKFLVEETAAE